MREISAKIIDATHLELSQPLNASPGDVIKISVPIDSKEEISVWRETAMKRLLNAYADEDAVYDEL
ncbi:MAG TPA: hypothetical protein VMJ32_01945 [Pirellulales bacterium]|nr:hypothetical protein [Pirellulales bacterium]